MDRIAKARQCIQKGRKKFKQHNKQSKQLAINLFKEGINLLIQESKYQQKKDNKDALRNKCSDLTSQMQQMKNIIKAQYSFKSTYQPPKNQNNQKQDQDQKALKSSLEGAIIRQKPDITWDQVSGLVSAKQALKQAVVLPILYPQIFVGQRKPWKGILLYGPPGTGKTLLAKACASQMQGGTFLSVSASNLISKFVGQSQKLIKYLFELAKKQKPAVIFMDQIDSLAASRTDGSNDNTRRVIAQLLVQMQGVGNSLQGVLVLGATNLPWQLDPAIRRRFQRKIYIQLPDKIGRLRIFQKMMQRNPNQIKPQQFQQLTQQTQGYSGSDIKNFIIMACYEPLRQAQKATYFKKNNQGQWIISSSGQIGAQKISLTQLGGVKVALRKVNFKDFSNCLSKMKPTVNPSSLNKYKQFTQQFGQRD